MQGMKKESKLRFRVEGIAKIDSTKGSKRGSKWIQNDVKGVCSAQRRNLKNSSFAWKVLQKLRFRRETNV